MSAPAPRALLVLLVTASTPAFAVDWVGIDGSTCEFDSIQEALDDPSAPTNLWIAEGVHADPGFVVERDLIAHRATSACADGGTSFATLDFGGLASAVIEDDVRASLYQIYLANGAALEGGNLRIDPGAEVNVYQGGFLNGHAYKGGGVAVMGTASLRTYGAVFSVNSATALGGGIYADMGADLQLGSGASSGLSFLGNSAQHGGGVMCESCDLLIHAPYGQTVWFWSNDVEFSGGAVDVTGAAGSLEIRDATFEENTAGQGGALSLSSTTAGVLDGLAFTGNEAGLGGAIEASDAALELRSSVFTGNTATADGGAIHIHGTDLFASGLTFSGNAAGELGGALHANGGSLTLNESMVDDNDALQGGGVALEDTAVGGVEAVSFSGNAASLDGGAIFVSGAPIFPIASASFDENSAVGKGGAIFGDDAGLDAVDTDWTGNSAAQGGALFMQSGETSQVVALDRGSLAGNSVTGAQTGSAIHVSGADMTLSLRDAEAIDNTSTSAATAAIVASGGAAIEGEFITVAGNDTYGVATLSGAAATLSCSVVWGNGTGGVFGTGSASNSDIQGITWGAGSTNVNVDPLYADAAGADYRLSAASPMRNFCDLVIGHTALNGVTRDIGTDVTDAGAFETVD